MPAGHTKFAPDLYFGLFKKKLSRSSAHCIKDICQIATSANSSIEVVVAGTERSKVYIPTYDWAKYFQDKKGKKVNGITTYFHFKTSEAEKGVMYCRDTLEAEEIPAIIFPPKIAGRKMTGFPERIIPEGLSDQLKQYLYNKIRPYVRENKQDILCPKPL